MKQRILTCILVVFLMICHKANALVIFQPEKSELTIREKAIYFCGKQEENERIYINGNLVKPEKNGAFACSVPLKEGLNLIPVGRMCLFDDIEIFKYSITRTQSTPAQDKFVQTEKRCYKTSCDNAILRSTPIDGGANRLGYLPKGTKLYTDGEKNRFSRVFLTQNCYGWVMTKDLTKAEGNPAYTPNKVVSDEVKETDTETRYIITLSDNCPYSAEYKDGKLVVCIYNLNEVWKKEIPLGHNPRYSVVMGNNQLNIIVKKNPQDMIIVIDPGHGGTERGAIGCLGDKEKDLNLKVGLCLKDILEKNGYKVCLTRETDSFVSLSGRTDCAKSKNAMFFISIHLNSVPYSKDPNSACGTTCYYYNPQSEAFAQSLVKQVSNKLSTKNNGTVQASLAVIRPTDYISALIELAYLVNPKDSLIYSAEDFPQKSAEGLFEGLKEYVSR